MLAPRSSRKFLSYLTGKPIPALRNTEVSRGLLAQGWLTVTGWQALVASGGYLGGTVIQGLIVLNNPDYNFQRWHGTLLFWAIVSFALFLNTVTSRLLPKVEGLILCLHLLGFFAIFIPLVYMAPHGRAVDVFTVFLNEGGWPTQGLSFFVGLIGNVFAFLGKFKDSNMMHLTDQFTRS